MENDLLSFNSKKGLFTIILISLIIIILEIIIFYAFFAPTVTREIDSGIDKISKKISQTINTQIKTRNKKPIEDAAITKTMEIVFSDQISNKMQSMADNELETINLNNDYTIYSAFFLVIVLSSLLVITHLSIKKDIQYDKNNTNFTRLLIIALITVFCLLAFQVIFYYYAKQYKYMGSLGYEEIMYDIIDNIGS